MCGRVQGHLFVGSGVVIKLAGKKLMRKATVYESTLTVKQSRMNNT